MSDNSIPPPDAPFTDIWDYFWTGYREMGMSDEDACHAADNSASEYAR